MLAFVEGVDCIGSIDMTLEVDKSEAFGLPFGIGLKDSRGDRSEFYEHLLELFLGDFRVQVLDIDVGKLFLLLIDLGHPFLVEEPHRQLGPHGNKTH